MSLFCFVLRLIFYWGTPSVYRQKLNTSAVVYSRGFTVRLTEAPPRSNRRHGCGRWCGLAVVTAVQFYGYQWPWSSDCRVSATSWQSAEWYWMCVFLGHEQLARNYVFIVCDSKVSVKHEARTAEIPTPLYGRYIYYVGGISAVVKLLDWRNFRNYKPINWHIAEIPPLYGLHICYVRRISAILKLLDQWNCYVSGNSAICILLQQRKFYPSFVAV